MSQGHAKLMGSPSGVVGGDGTFVELEELDEQGNRRDSPLKSATDPLRALDARLVFFGLVFVLVIMGTVIAATILEPSAPYTATTMRVLPRLELVPPHERAVKGKQPTFRHNEPDYYQMSADEYVHDMTSNDELQRVNLELCIVNQLGYDKMLNQPQYVALVDLKRCGANSWLGGGAQREHPMFLSVVVSATRRCSSQADCEETPLSVRYWLEPQTRKPRSGSQQAPATYYAGSIDIFEGSSEEHRFGRFVMKFASRSTKDVHDPNFRVSSVMVVTGRLLPGDDGLLLDVAQLQVSRVTETSSFLGTSCASHDGTNGVSKLKSVRNTAAAQATDSWTQAIRYTNTHVDVLTAHGDTLEHKACFSRKMPDVGVYIERYNLYDESTGALIDFDTGTSFIADEDEPGTFTFGHGIGYLYSDGEIVEFERNHTKLEGLSAHVGYSQLSRGQEIRLHRAPGTLMRARVASVPTSELAGLEFRHYNYTSLGRSRVMGWVQVRYNPGTQGFEAYANDEFRYKDGHRGFVRNTWPVPVPVPTEENGRFAILWSEALAGPAFYVPEANRVDRLILEAVKPDDEEVFAGSKRDQNLMCLWDCPKPHDALRIDSFQSRSGPFLRDPISVNNAIPYRINSTSMHLRQGFLDISMDHLPHARGTNWYATPHSAWGVPFLSGAMVTQDQLAQLRSAGATLHDALLQLPHVYIWSMQPGGGYAWANTVTRGKEGTPLHLNAPVTVVHRHTADQDWFNADQPSERVAVLRFWGNGIFTGLPRQRVSTDGYKIDDGGTQSVIANAAQHEFAIRDGSSLSTCDQSGDRTVSKAPGVPCNVVIKAAEVQQVLSPLKEQDCSYVESSASVRRISSACEFPQVVQLDSSDALPSNWNLHFPTMGLFKRTPKVVAGRVVAR